MAELSELRRSTTDGKVAGVCVMLADRWQVDPLLVRVAALLLALSSGIGLVLYAAAWALIPAQGSERAPIDAVFPGVRRVGRPAGVALLVAACLLAAALVGHLVPFGIGPALVMGAVWYFGWYRPEQRRRAALPETAEPPRLAARPFAGDTEFTQAAAIWQRRVQEHLQTRQEPTRREPPGDAPDPGYSMQAFLTHPDPAGLFPPQPKPVESGPAPRESGRPARRRTGRMHLIGWALALLCVGSVAALDRSFGLPFFAYPAAALLAIGLTLVIGTWLPRPRGLVIVGALLAIVIGVSTVPVPEMPTKEVAYSSVAELPAVLEQEDAGTIAADLSGLRLDRDATYAVGVDVGRIAVRVPADANVRVEWSVDVGDAQVLDQPTVNGVELRDTTLSRGTEPAGPTLTIEARVGLGRLEVTR